MALITKEDISKIEQDIKDKESSVEAQTKSKESLLETSKQLSKDQKEREDELAVTKGEEEKLNKAMQDAEANLKSKESAIEQADDAFKAAESAVAAAKDAEAAADQACYELDKEISELKDEISERAQDLVRYGEDEAKLQGIIDNNPSTSEEYKNATTKINDLRAEKADVQSKQDTAQASLNSSEAAKAIAETTRQTAVNNAKNAIVVADDAQKVFDDARVDLEVAKDAYSETEADFKNVKSDNDSRAVEIEDIKKEKDAVNSNLDATEAKLDRTTVELKELKEGVLLKAYNEQEDQRVSAFRNGLNNAARLEEVLYGKVNEQESSVMNSDTSVLKESIKKDIFDFDTNGSEILEREIDSIKSKEGALTAERALSISRSSLFDITKILEDIKSKAEKGQTNLIVNGSFINGLECLALIELGYKVTHVQSKSSRTTSGLDFVIDWSIGKTAS